METVGSDNTSTIFTEEENERRLFENRNNRLDLLIFPVRIPRDVSLVTVKHVFSERDDASKRDYLHHS